MRIVDFSSNATESIFKLLVELPKNKTEALVTITPLKQNYNSSFKYPYPIEPQENERIILPYGDGLGLDVTDTAVFPNMISRMNYSFSETHSFNMPWWSDMTPEQINQIKDMGFIATRYSNVSDFCTVSSYGQMANPNPNISIFPEEYSVLTSDSTRLTNWPVAKKGGGNVYLNVFSSKLLSLRMPEIEADLNAKPYNGRFVDVIGASDYLGQTICLQRNIHPIAKVNHQMIKEHTPIPDRHRPLIRNLHGCQIQNFHQSVIGNEGALSFTPFYFKFIQCPKGNLFRRRLVNRL
ncbi:MAG: hypothetical protein M0R40_06940 [Firmicutes bacterium]|nr:hypothetical protein [Bacillota bacterium]